MTPTQAIIQEATSHAMWLVLLPAIYWLQRRLPVYASITNILAHAAATVPVSLAHVLGMVALRAGRPLSLRVGAWLAALLVFGWIVSVALTKDPLGLLRLFVA